MDAKVPGGATAPSRPVRVVAIGSSAGGLEALEALLTAVTPGNGTAYVVAQHLAPEHPSLMVDLLSRITALTVVEAADGAALAPDVVAIAPPDRDIRVTADRLEIASPEQRLGPAPSIDLLFESLAEHWGARSAAIVLSGTGTDGANGLRVVRAAGGFTMVQAPDSARFDGMPRAAISLGGVDLVDSAENLGARLAGLGPAATDWFVGTLPAAEADMLSAFTTQLRRVTGIDFSRFKEQTLIRQVQRRMSIREIGSTDDYFALLAGDPDEAHALAGNLLVTVTAFFRDAEAYASLRDALEPDIARRSIDDPIRVWVPGCATGEEAYSLAMVIADLLGNPSDLSNRLKVFGTDLDEVSLGVARRGVYPPLTVSRIPESLRERYIRVMPDGWKVSDLLRECTVFARHDVGVDPPFPRIDLVSCRNTFIYFAPALQRQALRSFEFSLRPGGLLFLGSAESLDAKSTAFVPVDQRWRVFRRTSVASPLQPFTPMTIGERTAPRPVAATSPREPDRAPVEARIRLLEELLRSDGQTCLVFDDNHALVHVIGDVGPYCRVPEGDVAGAGGSFLRPELQEEARALVLLSRADGRPVAGRRIHLEDSGLDVALQAQPLSVDGAAYVAIRFLTEPGTSDEATAVVRPEGFDRELERLERELLASQESLRRSLADLQASNEELEASSEELQAASEELQAANEELQASNEELQATNDELGKVNRELVRRGAELEQISTDLRNIQNSQSQGLVILDENLNVVRFTPLAVRVFALLDTDTGRPLVDLPTTLEIPGLAEALADVADDGGRFSLEIGDDSVSYLLQILPYLAADGGRQGLVLTLTDVTEMAKLRQQAEEALRDLQTTSEALARKAAFDDLTGLHNRGFLAHALEREITRSQRSGGELALAWIDLDRFKEANDQFGHHAGDLALRTTAERLATILRGTDVVGRLGGDEFGVIISGHDRITDLDLILERVVTALRAPIVFEGHEITTGASVGVAVFPQDGEDADGLLRAADAAMYAVKHVGGGGYAYFDASMNVRSDERRALRTEVARALADRSFALHYQPILDPITDAVWGIEALVRWERDGITIPAADFVPFCEDSGQIRELGLLTLALLSEDLHEIYAAGHADLHVAINMSVAQLEDPALTTMLRAWPMPAGLRGIVIEARESVLDPERARAQDTLAHLVALGAQISLDHAAGGYWHLDSASRVPIAYVKLDQSFADLVPSPRDRETYRKATIDVAHSLGARAVVMRVEDAEHLDSARDAGADFVEGYALAEPMACAALLEWLADRAAHGIMEP